jgi:hypothetical protein
MFRALPWLCWLASCGGPEAGAPDDTGEAGYGPGCAECVLADGHNYSLSSTLDAEVYELAAQTDAIIDWSGLTVDVQGQPVAAGDVDRVVLVAFLQLSPDEIATGLATDTLQQSDATLFVVCEPDGATQCALSEFSILGSSLDVEEVFLADQGTWLVVPSTQGQVGGRTFAFLQASSTSTATTAAFDNETAALGVDVDLRSLDPLVVVEGGELIVQWGALTQDGLGNPMQVSSLNQLLVARSPWAVSDVEANILDLERDATELWSMDLGGGAEADLSELVGPRPFEGLDGSGTWWLGLRCSGCQHPAPRFLTQMVLGDEP